MSLIRPVGPPSCRVPGVCFKKIELPKSHFSCFVSIFVTSTSLRLAPRTRSAAAGQEPRPLGRGGFTVSLLRLSHFDRVSVWLTGTPSGRSKTLSFKIRICHYHNESAFGTLFSRYLVWWRPYEKCLTILKKDYKLSPESGHSSVGRVQASQAWCRGFEPRCPLHVLSRLWRDSPFSLFEAMLNWFRGPDVCFDQWIFVRILASGFLSGSSTGKLLRLTVAGKRA